MSCSITIENEIRDIAITKKYTCFNTFVGLTPCELNKDLNIEITFMQIHIYPQRLNVIGSKTLTNTTAIPLKNPNILNRVHMYIPVTIAFKIIIKDIIKGAINVILDKYSNNIYKVLFLIPFEIIFMPSKFSSFALSNIPVTIVVYSFFTSVKQNSTIPIIIPIKYTPTIFIIVPKFSLMYFCILLLIKKSPYNTLCYMVNIYASFSLSATASLSHLLFNSSSA